jgi:hypothetical protein
LKDLKYGNTTLQLKDFYTAFNYQDKKINDAIDHMVKMKPLVISLEAVNELTETETRNMMKATTSSNISKISKITN